MNKNEQKEGFLPILLGTLADNLLGSVLTGKRVIRVGEEVIRPSGNFQCLPIL